VAKNTGRNARTGLLEPEEANRTFRSKFNVETAEIPDPVLDEPANREAEKPFLRSPRRVPVRRRGGSRFASRFGLGTRWVRLLQGAVVVAVLGLVAMAGFAAQSFFLHNRVFILPSAGNIQVNGNRVVTRSQVRAFFAPDVGHSIFGIPLEKRKAQLQQIQWVRTATIMRLWPNQLRVTVKERTPVAFALDGNTVRLVDDQGVLLNLPGAAAQHDSFPVLTGIAAADPLSIRAARIAMYLQFVHALDAEGSPIASTLSQVDVSDPEDIRAIFLGTPRQPWVHFGDSDYLARYQAYQTHLAAWLQQYPQLRAVDMRYGKQVVLDTGSVATNSSTPLHAGSAADLTLPNGAAPPNKDATDASGSSMSPVSTESVTNKGGSSIPLVRTAKSSARKKTKHPAAARHRSGTHHGKARSRSSRHTPERGHTVRHPIMHTVSGM
jgi:cell division protein FtsQ